MNDNFFIDTNIFVYSVLPGEAQKRVHALDLIDRAISTGKGVISYQVRNSLMLPFATTRNRCLSLNARNTFRQFFGLLWPFTLLNRSTFMR